jgi:hypothetical protein
MHRSLHLPPLQRHQPRRLICGQKKWLELGWVKVLTNGSLPRRNPHYFLEYHFLFQTDLGLLIFFYSDFLLVKWQQIPKKQRGSATALAYDRWLHFLEPSKRKVSTLFESHAIY